MQNNSSIQIINSEKAVGTILSKFSTNFIMDVIDDNIKMKFRPFNVGPANFVIVLEQNYQMTKLQNPSFVNEIENNRAQTYREIINKICKFYNLQFIGEQYQELNPNDLFNLASILFDIFVSNFTNRMIEFFVRYIVNNKDDIYNSIENAEEIRKNKEMTSYGRKMYTDPKLVVIHSSLNSVIMNIASHDIPLALLLTYLTDRDTAAYLSGMIVDINDIYKNHYASYILNELTKADIFTSIKLTMQNMVSDRPIDPGQYVS